MGQSSCCSVTKSCSTFRHHDQASLSFTISWSLLKFMSIESVTLSHHIIYWPLLLLPSIFPNIRVLSSDLALPIRWPKYWSFSFSISTPKGYSGLISFRIDWFDLLAVQGSQESSLAPQFESINSWTLSLLYGSTLTSVRIILQNWTASRRIIPQIN